MPYLYEFERQIPRLLAEDSLDASRGALFPDGNLRPNTANRTILIGLGGMGVSTIDKIKGEVMKRLDSSWCNYISFLAIDASWIELDQAAYLTCSEKVHITKAGVVPRMRNDTMHPPAVRRFLKRNGVQLATALESPGSGRLIGKIKIHDRAIGQLGVDEEIVSRLERKCRELEPMISDGIGYYQVYVIGSICGSTGSGGFLEIPALVNRAMPSAKVDAVLYLPDVMAAMGPYKPGRFYANGYAALKELNYYMGMMMRPGYPEKWSYNSLAFPELALKDKFFDKCYLIGSPTPESPQAQKLAVETVSEWLFSQFISDYTFPSGFHPMQLAREYLPGSGGQLEAAGEFHEFPKCFSAMGFAEACAPNKLIRAYMVGNLCKKAGFIPVSPVERAAALATGHIPPFRSKDDLLNAIEGTAKARAVLAPMEKLLGIIHSGSFNFTEDLNEQEITWTKIKQGHYDIPDVFQKTAMVIRQRTGPEMMEDLRRKICEAYDAYRKNVQEYVRTEGPYAFVNLYLGNFKQVNGEFGIGIKEMIKNLIDGKTLEGKRFQYAAGKLFWIPVEEAKKILDSIKITIASENSGIFGIETKNNKTHAAQWVHAYNTWGTARINAVRRDVALGPNGAIQTLFLQPAKKLAWEVDTFGRILECLTGIYLNHGSKLDTYFDFHGARDSHTEVNLAAVSADSWRWVKDQADAAWEAANAQTLRNKLVDDFFGIAPDGTPNSHRWLDVPPSCVRGSDADIELVSPDVAIPAREIFDYLMRDQLPVDPMISVEELFLQQQNMGRSFQETAAYMIQRLRSHSVLHFRGDIPMNRVSYYLTYPASLRNGTGAGPAIANAIDNAANMYLGNIHISTHNDYESVKLCQVAEPMEIYRLHDLAFWQEQYEYGPTGVQNAVSYLHGMSPDVTKIQQIGWFPEYTEGMPWADYPSIVPSVRDPRTPDPATGMISREGQLRLALDKTIQRARELGVLYLEEVPGMGNASEWIVKRVHCNMATEWRFDPEQFTPDATTGLLPLGKELAEAVAVQNNRTLADISRTVTLEFGGVMNQPALTEEMAWARAARVLRAHVPMFIEVRETMKKFEQWAKDIEAYNDNVKKELLPAKMIWMMKGRLLRKNEDGTWVFNLPGNPPRNVAVLTDVMMRFLPPEDRTLIKNGMLGYYLFKQLCDILTTVAEFDEAYQAARDSIAHMVANQQTDQLLLGDELAYSILTEINALAQKGARLDGDADAKSNPIFAAAMAELGISREQVREIELFYYRVGLGEMFW